MELIAKFIDLFLHLDQYLNDIIADYRYWTYLILFLVIFCETGLVVTPFLPGDSLLFAVGALTATGDVLNIYLIFLLLLSAAVLGDSTNYFVGRYVGPRVFHKNYRLLKKEYLIKTQQFYEKHGGKTIVIARFFPIIRTFAPFVAGVGTMNYRRFLSFSFLGSILWVGLFVFGGYFFGNIPLIKNNFSMAVVFILLISTLPPVIQVIKNNFKKTQ